MNTEKYTLNEQEKSDILDWAKASSYSERMAIDKTEAAILSKVLPDLEAMEKEIPRWISVNERLPEKSGLVLITVLPCNDQYIAHYKHGQKIFTVYGAGRNPILDMTATHWMPLPPPPAEG